MTQINTIIKKELLRRTQDSKLYVMTNLTAVASSCNVYSSEVILNIQKLFLTCDTNFSYDLSQTRNGFKIVALDYFNPTTESVNAVIDNNNQIELAVFMLSQFNNKISTKDIKDIIKFYEALVTCSEQSNLSNNALFFAITKQDNRIYNQINNSGYSISSSKIDYLLDLIITHGYAFEKDNYIFWKIYSPNAEVSDEDTKVAFTVVNKDISLKEENKEIQEKEEIVKEEPLTIGKAFNFLAKELGLALNENESKNKLEEMVAMTNELIMDFNDLQDWEKLKSWNKFVENWQTIMREATNDRS